MALFSLLLFYDFQEERRKMLTHKALFALTLRSFQVPNIWLSFCCTFGMFTSNFIALWSKNMVDSMTLVENFCATQRLSSFFFLASPCGMRDL